MQIQLQVQELAQEQQPEIIFEDASLLILFKPPHWFVHPPENPKYRRGLKRKTCVQWLMDKKNIKAYPAHRIDAATEGILIFGKTKEATANLNLQFKNHLIKKTYWAVVRGWFKEPDGKITLPLELDSTRELADCETNYKTLKQIEHNYSVNPKFQTTRYSLLEVQPITGRWHQIRRHMNRVSHPIIGDREHGDSHHNRYFRDQLNIEGLCLQARKLGFTHPELKNLISFQSPATKKWENIEKLFDFSE